MKLEHIQALKQVLVQHVQKDINVRVQKIKFNAQEINIKVQLANQVAQHVQVVIMYQAIEQVAACVKLDICVAEMEQGFNVAQELMQ